MSLLAFFTDPVLRAPTIGSILICFASGLVGCLVFLQKRSLVGEALSHASYPGVVLSIVFASLFFPFSEAAASIGILLGAMVTGLLGLFAIHRLERRLNISSDAALCLVLSLFFGVGILIASRLQITHTLWFHQIQIFLFGQAATMTDAHLFLYGGLALAVLAAMTLLFRLIEVINFDPVFARQIGVPIKRVELFMNFLLVLAIVVGMRSVGVVLMSGMLIAPAVAARQWTYRLSTFLALSGLFGALSGFLGNSFSVWLPAWTSRPHLSLPTGPMIILVAMTFCLLSLLLAPQKGLLIRGLRVLRFRMLCKQENCLKAFYRNTPCQSSFWVLWQMKKKGWVHGKALTESGKKKAEKLIRLHRLWEVYLVHMGQKKDRVHYSAEEMEHILTPEIEKELAALLGHPKRDPHSQPIPQQGGQ